MRFGILVGRGEPKASNTGAGMLEDLENLLKPIREDSPAGDEIEYDPEFAEMEKASVGTDDQEFGETKIEGQPANWALVRKLSVRLLKKSKDIRVAAYLVDAELRARGLEGLRDGLVVVNHIVTDFWEAHFPQLDPDDDNDPTIRLNALARLTSVGGLIRQLRITAIARSRSAGVLTWTDCAIARGEIPTPEGMENPPNQKKVDAIVESCDRDELHRWSEAVSESLELLRKIEEGFANQVGTINSPEFDPLRKELDSISKLYRGWASQIGPPPPQQPDQPQDTATEETSSNSTATPRQMQTVAFGSGSPNNREEVLIALDKMLDWFEKNEPSSPIPMLLRRAKRLSRMSFLEVLRDISPDGLSQAILVGGQESTEN